MSGEGEYAFAVVDDAGDRYDAPRSAILEAIRPLGVAEAVALLGSLAGQLTAVQKKYPRDVMIETARANVFAGISSMDASQALKNLSGENS